MKYFEVKFNIQAPDGLMQDARDILSALAGETGFETFEDTEAGLTGYVQQTLFDEPMLKAQIDNFPLPDCRIDYSVSQAEDKDWNEQWEQQGFEPIVVDDSIVIHDGRHLPQKACDISIEIDAHLAFGTGTHETTRMMVRALRQQNVDGRRALDCGTGTGILAIAALKLGAREAVGYDIDEWSVDNARHNAVINRTDSSFRALLGDVSILKEVEGTFDIVMANINRNILLTDMPAFAGKMGPHSTLLLSGFYTTDTGLLTARAGELGLHTKAQLHDGNWACMILSNDDCD